jgi:hypothetical protein
MVKMSALQLSGCRFNYMFQDDIHACFTGHEKFTKLKLKSQVFHWSETGIECTLTNKIPEF